MNLESKKKVRSTVIRWIIIFLESHDVSWLGLGMACKKFSHIKKFHMFWNPPWMHETIYKYGIVHQRNIVNEQKIDQFTISSPPIV